MHGLPLHSDGGGGAGLEACAGIALVAQVPQGQILEVLLSHSLIPVGIKNLVHGLGFLHGGGTADVLNSWHRYEHSVAEITENLVALLGLQDSPFRDIVFLEQHPADCFGPLWFDLESSPVHSN